MDLTIGELMQAAARNDERALRCRTLWSPSPSASGVRCQQGINVQAVMNALRAEAVLRGYAHPPPGRISG
jgi:hypothetical protein